MYMFQIDYCCKSLQHIEVSTIIKGGFVLFFFSTLTPVYNRSIQLNSPLTSESNYGILICLTPISDTVG